MTTEARRNATARYDAANTVQLKLKLNLTTDKDVLDALEASGNKQGYIKELVRADIGRKSSDEFFVDALSNLLESGDAKILLQQPSDDMSYAAVLVLGGEHSGAVERWLAERFGALKGKLFGLEDWLYIQIGNGEDYQRVLWPLIERFAG